MKNINQAHAAADLLMGFMAKVTILMDQEELQEIKNFLIEQKNSCEDYERVFIDAAIKFIEDSDEPIETLTDSINFNLDESE